MRIVKNITNYTFLLLVFATCIEPYDFEPEGTDRALVVDASVTNEFKYHEINLGYTRPLDSTVNEGEENATITVLASEGPSFSFSHTGNGVYRSNEMFAGSPGASYQLRIEIRGEIFESPMIEMPEPVSIDSIYYELVQTIEQESGTNQRGFQFYVDSRDPGKNARNFRYEWYETYKIWTPFYAGYTYDPEKDTALNVNFEDNPFDVREDTISICYQSDTSRQVLIGTSVSPENSSVIEYPILFIQENDQSLVERISINVKKYSITPEAYNYYRQLRISNESGGSLFDRQQGAVPGNIVSTENQDDPILGYFEVSGVSSERIFISAWRLQREFIGEWIRPRFRYDCPRENIEVIPFDTVWRYVEVYPQQRLLYPVYPPSTGPVGAYFINRECSDCSWYADTNVPSFWIEDVF